MENSRFLYGFHAFIKIRTKSTVFNGIFTLNYDNISGYAFRDFLERVRHIKV